MSDTQPNSKPGIPDQPNRPTPHLDSVIPAKNSGPFPPELWGSNASKEERMWGMGAHLVALAGFVIPFANIIGPLIIWALKHAQSRFVAFHAIQSLRLQVIAIIPIVLMLVGLKIYGLGCFLVPVAVLVVIWVPAYALYGAYQVACGRNFEYYLIGPWVRKSMGLRGSKK